MTITPEEINIVRDVCEEIRVNDLMKPAEGIEHLAAKSKALYDTCMALIAKWEAEIAKPKNNFAPQCPECGSSYVHVVAATGYPMYVRCVSCSHRWAIQLPSQHPGIADDNDGMPVNDAQPATREAWRVWSCEKMTIVTDKHGENSFINYDGNPWSACVDLLESELVKFGYTELTVPAAQVHIDSLKKQIGEGAK